MNRRPLEELLAGTDGAFPRVTALVGAGGKTTLMYALAARMVAAGERVICTTTTKIVPPESLPLLLMEEEDAGDGEAAQVGRACLADGEDVERDRTAARIGEALTGGPCLVLAARRLPESGKLEGLSPEILARLVEALPGVRWIVEADGAARKPLKAPAAHEPALPLRLDCCVAVLGLDGVGRPLDDAYVHRAALACLLTGQAVGTMVTPHTLARLVVDEEGLFRTCPDSCRRLVFANKGDLPGAAEAARQACREAGPLAGRLEWAVGSAAEGWWVPLGILPPHDIP
ncbi:MAG TPA: putative selenium-dependent hydroxylase accessory protein YqeC [Candidatus Bilophila faecipullorum]|uniref:Selenium-dependent hydroxylase accessory protein YqeC n=1 Tax=Candidatus Bilophila faecipullorum TaxID=2838482 RepID=A0A9D1QYQ8_9BACT|nr:selenium cofactor biosynthesis protein YqeC [uncultured Bilophila sp.]HIW78516.1 putative selenium-dependent hydroxylase accessory protein YqeC [Candidatus Bilophila faecipullorum]